LQVWESNGVRVIDDTYNANAESMLAALQTLADLPCAGRRVAVLGDMAELGEHAGDAHREVGRRAAELGLDQIVAVGRFAGTTGEAARTAGASEVREFPDVMSAAAKLKDFVGQGDLVLLKASRVTGLEKLVEILRSSS
jgi:UDP-N-acetylmuramoyl-tripeptide--D-alanyl-D-alanine ligase